MRKYFTGTLLSMAVVLFFSGCQSTFSPQVDSLLQKMRTKVDPQGKLEGIQSKIVFGTFRRNSKDKGATIRVEILNPDMLRFDIVVPGEVSLVKAYNGEKGWEYSTKRGYRELKGNNLNALKFQAAFLNPSKRAEDIFSEIKMLGDAKVMGQSCYKLLCKPKKEFKSNPIIMFVDKKTLLLRKRIEEHGTPASGTFKVSTILDDYSSFDGILCPTTIISNANGDIMEYNATSVKWNEKINKAVFSPPKMLR